MKIVITIQAAIVAVLLYFGWNDSAATPRESCECRELRRIRVLLEHQAGIVCNEYRCLPVPTPTVPDGGELP
jgi:hypothetical protein